MEKVEVFKTVYMSVDGREFLTEEECKQWEELLKEVRYYRVRFAPDLTETGMYTRELPIMLVNPYSCDGAVIQKYLETELKWSPLVCGVQGCGWMPNYIVEATDPDYFQKFEPDKKVPGTDRVRWADRRHILTYDVAKVEKFFPVENHTCKVFNYAVNWHLK